MDLSTLLGDAYTPEMTLEDVSKALEGLNLVDPTSLPKSVDKKVFDKTASELAELKRQNETLKKNSLTKEEQLAAELAKAESSQKEFARRMSKLSAKELFVGAGLKEEDYADILETLVSEDAEETETRTKNLIKLLNSQKVSTEKALKAELLKGTPKPPAGKGGDAGYDNLIKDAQAKGDMAQVAALIRQRAENDKEN